VGLEKKRRKAIKSSQSKGVKSIFVTNSNMGLAHKNKISARIVGSYIRLRLLIKTIKIVLMLPPEKLLL